MSREQYTAAITVVSAQFEDVDNKYDPYVAFEHNNAKFRTKAAAKPGQHALWNERFKLESLHEPNELFL